MSTLFTKIINGEIPGYKIYEDKNTAAFLDIHPVLPGHVLVVPKREFEFVWNMPEDLYIALMLTVKKIALHQQERLGKKLVHERIVGTDIPHAHVHLIPFNEGEKIYNPEAEAAAPDHKALAVMAERLRF